MKIIFQMKDMVKTYKGCNVIDDTCMTIGTQFLLFMNELGKNIPHKRIR